MWKEVRRTRKREVLSSHVSTSLTTVRLEVIIRKCLIIVTLTNEVDTQLY